MLNFCVICHKPIFNYVPKYCCDDKDCDCKGLPINPIVCSKRCEDAGWDMVGYPYELRRIKHKIPLWNNRGMNLPHPLETAKVLSNIWRKKFNREPENGATLMINHKLVSCFEGIWIFSELYNHPNMFK